LCVEPQFEEANPHMVQRLLNALPKPARIIVRGG